MGARADSWALRRLSKLERPQLEILPKLRLPGARQSSFRAQHLENNLAVQRLHPLYIPILSLAGLVQLKMRTRNSRCTNRQRCTLCLDRIMLRRRHRPAHLLNLTWRSRLCKTCNGTKIRQFCLQSTNQERMILRTDWHWL